MPPPLFPNLNGVAFPVRRRPTTSTRIVEHGSGREVRWSHYADVLVEYELAVEGLDSNGSFPGLGANSLQSLVDLYVECRGAQLAFRYDDPTDNAVAGQSLGTGTGAKTAFTFVRTLGGTTATVSYVVAAAHVYLNGVTQPTGWSITGTNTLTFSTAPGNGVVVTADFTYQWLCRFLDDRLELEELMSGLWQIESLKFKTVKV
jgi:uncharacterized protein (TIGR02217 family)